jgi:hypothetical protein
MEIFCSTLPKIASDSQEPMPPDNEENASVPTDVLVSPKAGYFAHVRGLIIKERFYLSQR